MITFQRTLVTPELATEWLTRNVDNRKPSLSKQRQIISDIKRGTWRTTHQAIAFDHRGNLIDGQNRLKSIVKAGIAVWLYVARYDSNEDIRELPVDTGTPRNAAFILQCTEKDKQTIRSMIAFADGTRCNPTPSEIKDVLEQHEALLGRVAGCCNKTTKHRTSSHARVAVALRCFESPTKTDEIIEQYFRFTHMSDADLMWPSVLGLLRFYDSAAKLDPLEVLRRTWHAFNPEKRMLKSSRILDPSAVNRELRQIIRLFVGERIVSVLANEDDDSNDNVNPDNIIETTVVQRALPGLECVVS